MRIAIAGFHLESASSLSQVSDVSHFEENCQRGNALVTEYCGTNTVPGGFLAECDANGWQTVPCLYTYLGALGPASDEAVETYAEEIASCLSRAKPDAALIHLHGATWAHGYHDPERFMIDRMRAALGPDVPLIVCLDYHGNIDARTIDGADAVFAYQKSPHTDMAETGRRGARCLASILATGHRPAMAVEKPGVIVPSIFSATSLSPLRDILASARAREARAEGFLDISIMAGFAYGDASNTGFSVVVVSDEGQAAARTIAREFSDRIRKERAALYRPIQIYDPEDATDRAYDIARQSGRPVVLLEHADRLNDSTYLLSELAGRQEGRVAIPFLRDEAAARAAHAAGIGAEIDLCIGAWSSPQAGPRQSYHCEVLQTGEISYRISGEMLNGQRVDLGMTALLRIGSVEVSVVSNFAFTVDEDVFRVFGQNMQDYDIIVLRSKTHFRQFYEQAAKAILIVDTPDHGPADLTRINYRNVDMSCTYPFTED